MVVQKIISTNYSVWIEYHPRGHVMSDGELYVRNGIDTIKVGDSKINRFGSFDPTADMGYMILQDGYVYTFYTRISKCIFVWQARGPGRH